MQNLASNAVLLYTMVYWPSTLSGETSRKGSDSTIPLVDLGCSSLCGILQSMLSITRILFRVSHTALQSE